MQQVCKPTGGETVTIRVLLVDDQPIVRGGVRGLLEPAPHIQVVGEGADGVDALEKVRALRPDVLLMDMWMPRMDGIEATRRLHAEGLATNTSILILTVYDSDEHIHEALRAGADGYLLKDAPPGHIIDAIRAVAAGNAVLSPTVTRKMINAFARRPAISRHALSQVDTLTRRERDVFQLLVAGYDNKEVASVLTLGESTVKSHTQHLYQKLGVRDRVELVIFAYENGLLNAEGDGGGNGYARARRRALS
jgi:DNA-binding NarL/FixJ family response regulator